jgi:hypothetical protein
MAESYAQRKNAVNKALRQVRAVYRKADSQGELLERELDRMILRKTIVSPASMDLLDTKYDAYVKAVEAIASVLGAADVLSFNYVGL